MLIAGVDKYVVHMIPKGPCHIYIYIYVYYIISQKKEMACDMYMYIYIYISCFLGGGLQNITGVLFRFL